MSCKHGKIAAIGDRGSVLAFRTLGVETFVAAEAAQADEMLKKLAKEQYAVIFITEDLAAAIPDTLRVLKTRPYPVVVPIPAAAGATAGFARESLRKDVERALGTNI